MIAQISFGILALISVFVLAIVIANAQTSVTIFPEKENVTVPYINNNLNIYNTNEYGSNGNGSSDH